MKLHSVTIQDGNAWITQFQEIDYCEQGDSLGESLHNASHGLRSTISGYLRHFGRIDNLQPTPADVWAGYASDPTAVLREFNCTMVMTCPDKEGL